MAARSFIVGRRAAAATAALSGTILLAIPKTTLHAESPPAPSEPQRKPIYDDPLSDASTIAPSLPPASKESPPPTTPRPTDRLATQIGHARLFLHRQAATSEDWLNGVLARGLRLESSFTGTIAGLAPDPATGERVLPGALYVAVATMAGSIVVRRRNIVIRAFTPVGAGIAAGWFLLPHTMRNISDLIWKYEERVPVVAANHMRIRGAVEQGWKEANDRAHRVAHWSEARVAAGREAVEGWVRKGG